MKHSMRWHGRKQVLRWLSVALCLCLTGCSNAVTIGETQPGSAQAQTQTPAPGTESQTLIAKSEATYTLKKYSFEGSSADFAHAKFDGGQIYVKNYDEETGTWGIDRINVTDGKMAEFLRLNDPGEEPAELRSVCCFDQTADGQWRVLAVVFEPFEKEDAGKGETEGALEEGLEEYHPMEVKEYRLLTFDKDGKELGSMALRENFGQSDVWGTFMDMGVDGKGNILVWQNGYYLYSAEGRLLASKIGDEEVWMSANGIARSLSGDLWICYSTREEGLVTAKADFKEGTLDPFDGTKEFINSVGTVTADADAQDISADLLFLTNDKLFLYDEEKKEMTSLLEWATAGAQGMNLIRAGLFGSLVIAVPRTQKELLVFSPQDGEGPRKTVLLATLQKYSLDSIVAAYNGSQDKYQVKVVEYGRNATSSQEWQEPADRMVMDMLGDTPPDIFDLSPFIKVNLEPSVQDFMEKGYLEDLAPYLERSTKLSKEDFEEKALELCSWQGKIAALPTAYSIQTMSVSTADLGKKNGWSISDMIAYDKSHPEMGLIDGCTSQHFYSFCIAPNLEYFVDFDQKTTSFDSPEFREILEYALSYPSGDDIIYFNAPERLVRLEYLEGVADIQKKLNIHFDGKMQYIGYPSVDGTPLNFLRLASDGRAFSICSRGAEKEGAWDFIEFVQTMELDDTIRATYMPSNRTRYVNDYDGIPAHKAVLKKVIEELSKINKEYAVTEIFSDGTSYTFHPLTDGEKRVLEDLVKTARVKDPRFDKIGVIVYEELGTYFARQKSIDQVINVIDQRVRLYLLEN